MGNPCSCAVGTNSSLDVARGYAARCWRGCSIWDVPQGQIGDTIKRKLSGDSKQTFFSGWSLVCDLFISHDGYGFFIHRSRRFSRKVRDPWYLDGGAMEWVEWWNDCLIIEISECSDLPGLWWSATLQVFHSGWWCQWQLLGVVAYHDELVFVIIFFQHQSPLEFKEKKSHGSWDAC